MKLDIIGWVRGWRLQKFFTNLFEGKNQAEIDAAGIKAVEIVDRFKNLVNSPQVDFIEKLIPGNWDKKIIDKVRGALPLIIDKLIEGQVCASKPTADEKFHCAAAMLLAKGNDDKTIFLNRFAALVARVIADGKITLGSAIALVQLVWETRNANK